MGWLRAYWDWTGGNIGAMPLQSLILAVVSVVLRRPLSRAWRWLTGGDGRADIEDVKRAAAAAHKIAADLFEHHTGAAHADAPPKAESGDG